MGFSYGSVLALAVIPMVGSFILGCLFWGRFIFVRLLLWGASAILLVLVVSIAINHWMHNKEESALVQGVYYFDSKVSRFDSLDLNIYSSLMLRVNSDHTFVIDRQTPFFPCTTGKWAYDDDGDVIITECSFDCDKKSFQVNANGTVWPFEFIMGNGNRIIFKKSFATPVKQNESGVLFPSPTNNLKNEDSIQPQRVMEPIKETHLHDTVQMSGNFILFLRPDEARYKSYNNEPGLFEGDAEFGWGVQGTLDSLPNHKAFGGIQADVSVQRYILIKDCKKCPLLIDRDTIDYGYIISGRGKEIKLYTGTIHGGDYLAELSEYFKINR
jgi:hypothetical protein